MRSKWIPTLLACALLLGAYGLALGAKLQLDGKTPAEVEAEAARTGVVQRALRGKMLLKTVIGVLHLEHEDGRIAGATLAAEEEEVYDYVVGEGYRSAIMKTTMGKTDVVYKIPADAEHVFHLRPYMDGKRVEAQFQLVEPGGDTVYDLRFIDVLRGQSVDLPKREAEVRADEQPFPASGKVYYVAPGGSDDNSGTQDKPFQTIAKGVAALEAGDTLCLREGNYHEAMQIIGPKGGQDKPMLITSHEGERAVIDGSEDLDAIAGGPWEKHEGDVFKRRLTKPVWQVWQDDKMLMLSRWPKVTKNWTDDMAKQYNGRFPEPGTAWSYDSYYAWFDPSEARANFKFGRKRNEAAPPEEFEATGYDQRPGVKKLSLRSLSPLAAAGKSFEGAMIDGIASCATLITKHEAGSDRFEVLFNHFGEEFVDEISLGRFVIKNHLNCLDLPGEWAFDAKTRTLYVKMAAGESPADHRYRGKTVAMAARVYNSANVRIRNIDFFACRLAAVNSPDAVVEGCVFSYPTYRASALGFEGMDDPPGDQGDEAAKQFNAEDKFIPSALLFSPGGTLRDCELRYYQSSGVEFQGPDPLIENCYLHHGERYGVIFTRSPGAVARRNTVHSTLSQGAIRIRKTPEGRFTAELNYGYDYGTHRSDASGVQVQAGSQNYHMFRNNWFHHSECKACRFDGQPAGTLGTMVGNVGWRLWQGLQVKGDYQKSYNNTFFACGARHDISVINQVAFGGGTHSITRNNVCDRISGHRQDENLEGEGRIPGFHTNNWNGLVTGGVAKTLLRDPDNFDFRPLNNPAIVDAGTTEIDHRFVEGSALVNVRFVKAKGNNTSGAMDDPAHGGGGEMNAHVQRYLGEAPDVGAYEYGDRRYWIPGRQVDGASFPIPPNRAKHVKTDADLMWLEGKNAVAHEVYFGDGRKTVLKAGNDSPEYVGSFTDSNIYTPKDDLKKDTTYFWRVDAVNADGSTVKGAVWRFTPDDGHYEEFTRIPRPEDFAAELKDDGSAVLTWTAVDDERLAGYNIYRRWGNFVYVKLNGVKLTRQPILETTFTDTTIDGKGKFFYVIESVDKTGMASHESEAVEVMVEGTGADDSAANIQIPLRIPSST
jgi:hypothetical protein